MQEGRNSAVAFGTVKSLPVNKLEGWFPALLLSVFAHELVTNRLNLFSGALTTATQRFSAHHSKEQCLTEEKIPANFLIWTTWHVATLNIRLFYSNQNKTFTVVTVFHCCVLKQVVERGACPGGVQIREELWLAGCADDTHPAHHYSASPRGGTMAGLQAQLSATVAAAAGVEVRDGCQVSTTLGQHSIWRRAAALCFAAGSEAPVDNICHRGWTICPGPGVGDHLSPLRPEAAPHIPSSLPQTWTWAVVQRQMQRTQPRHSRSCWRLAVVSHVWLCISCWVINACRWMPRNKVLACEFTDLLIEVPEGI